MLIITERMRRRQPERIGNLWADKAWRKGDGRTRGGSDNILSPVFERIIRTKVGCKVKEGGLLASHIWVLKPPSDPAALGSTHANH